VGPEKGGNAGASAESSSLMPSLFLTTTAELLCSMKTPGKYHTRGSAWMPRDACSLCPTRSAGARFE
jgi:hypothetical protein